MKILYFIWFSALVLYLTPNLIDAQLFPGLYYDLDAKGETVGLLNSELDEDHHNPQNLKVELAHQYLKEESNNDNAKEGTRRNSVTDFYVDKSGSRDFGTVQEAVDAVMDGNTDPVTIYIAEGTYCEKVHVPKNKPYITFQGRGLDKTEITWNDNANKMNSTFTTSTVSIEADYFIGRNISFKNSAPRPEAGIEGAQAIALQVLGDKSAFYGCGMFGYQDTLNDHQGRHLFRECHIEGQIDFIFGNAKSLYERCVLQSNAVKTGAITAHGRLSNAEATGFSFKDCSIVGSGKILLGRAWRPYARVVFASTFMEDIIESRGWDDRGNKSADETLYFGEYKNSGPGANMTGRVPYSKALTSQEAAEFIHIDWIDGSDWLH